MPYIILQVNSKSNRFSIRIESFSKKMYQRFDEFFDAQIFVIKSFVKSYIGITIFHLKKCCSFICKKNTFTQKL